MNNALVFEQPIDVVFSTDSLFGWPKLLVSVWQEKEKDVYIIRMLEASIIIYLCICSRKNSFDKLLWQAEND